MKKIINISHKRLVFPKFDLAFDIDEIKEIPNNVANELLCNSSVKEVMSEKEKLEEFPVKMEKKTKQTKKK